MEEEAELRADFLTPRQRRSLNLVKKQTCEGSLSKVSAPTDRQLVAILAVFASRREALEILEGNLIAAGVYAEISAKVRGAREAMEKNAAGR